jgi:hypothetical protein
MYNQKMVASIKVKGKILREFKDTVYIPFGAEYSILLKNLNTVRCVVNVFIDGDNMVPGGVVLGAGQTVDLERSVKNGNLSAGNKFKFIERTGAIEDGPRGVKLEDGLIRVEYQFEKAYPSLNVNDWYQKQILPQQPYHGPFFGSIARDTAGDRFSVTAAGMFNQVNIGGALRGVDTSQNGATMQASASAAINQFCATNGITSEVHDGAATMDSFVPKNDVGITVAGSKSTQQFQNVTMGALEVEKHSIVLKLLGETPDNRPVLDPVTVDTKTKCTTCGIQSKRNAKFCAHCGTSLVVYA